MGNAQFSERSLIRKGERESEELSGGDSWWKFSPLGKGGNLFAERAEDCEGRRTSSDNGLGRYIWNLYATKEKAEMLEGYVFTYWKKGEHLRWEI